MFVVGFGEFDVVLVAQVIENLHAIGPGYFGPSDIEFTVHELDLLGLLEPLLDLFAPLQTFQLLVDGLESCWRVVCSVDDFVERVDPDVACGLQNGFGMNKLDLVYIREIVLSMSYL